MEAVRTTLRQMHGNPKSFSDPLDLRSLHEVAEALGYANELATNADFKHKEVMAAVMKAHSPLRDMVSQQLMADTHWSPLATEMNIDDGAINWIMMRMSVVLRFDRLNDILQEEWRYDEE